MKKILLTIFAVLFFVLPNRIVASQEKKTECLGPLLSFMKRGWENLKNVRRKKKIYPAGQSDFEKIPSEVLTEVWKFICPIPSNVSKLEYHVARYDSYDVHEIEYHIAGSDSYGSRPCVVKVPQSNLEFLIKMRFISTSIRRCIDYYLKLSRRQTKKLEIVMFCKSYHRPGHLCTFNQDQVSEDRLRNSIKIHGFKEKFCPEAEIVFLKRVHCAIPILKKTLT